MKILYGFNLFFASKILISHIKKNEIKIFGRFKNFHALVAKSESKKRWILYSNVTIILRGYFPWKIFLHNRQFFENSKRGDFVVFLNLRISHAILNGFIFRNITTSFYQIPGRSENRVLFIWRTGIYFIYEFVRMRIIFKF